MYFKLSIRNAKRSIVNYLLYITTMTILLSTMEVSNCIAIVGKQVGFQTISLPLLITIIQAILVGYIDDFILRQRAKEFANYLTKHHIQVTIRQEKGRKIDAACGQLRAKNIEVKNA